MKNHILPLVFLVISIGIGGVYLYQNNREIADIHSVTIDNEVPNREQVSDQYSDTSKNITAPSEQKNPVSSDTFTKSPESLPEVAIIDAVFTDMDAFIKKYPISKVNLDFIKKVVNYGADAFGRYSATFFIVEEPSDKDIIYFTDDEYSDEYSNDMGTGGIYKLNINNNTLTKIFEFPTRKMTYRLMGIQGNQLLFLELNPSNSPGPCFDPWMAVYEYQMDGESPQQMSIRFVSIDLNNPSTGLRDFSVSASKYRLQEKSNKECRAGL